ncbi:hypothetical protein [Pelagibaculum spongiae]|uniref:Peptidase C58 YopT-type domain-containing protein n=1 Tax=Pelagibaculum spongiae TaxID=2080658 RepID=A0A2V1H068_9GAMM|nr:hypothetical protein [Pelagibaculum spongiae]PVZ67769.1 hypothetical protein DC094_15160 [Pelagibaculum spongiae]
MPFKKRMFDTLEELSKRTVAHLAKKTLIFEQCVFFKYRSDSGEVSPLSLYGGLCTILSLIWIREQHDLQCLKLFVSDPENITELYGLNAAYSNYFFNFEINKKHHTMLFKNEFLVKKISNLDISEIPYTKEAESNGGLHSKIFFFFHEISAPGDYLVTYRFGENESSTNPGHVFNIHITEEKMMLFDSNIGEITFEKLNPGYLACFFTHTYFFHNKKFLKLGKGHCSISSYKIVDISIPIEAEM